MHKKVAIAGLTHFVTMSILGVVGGIAALGVGFSDDATLHFWWNLAFGIWVVVDFPVALVAYALFKNPDYSWVLWIAQVLTSIVWGLVIARLWDFKTRRKAAATL